MAKSPPVGTFGSHFVSAALSVSDESKVKHQQQELEQSWEEVRRAAAGRQQAERDLRLIQAQLGECRVSLEERSRELFHQQERSDRGECARGFILA